MILRSEIIKEIGTDNYAMIKITITEYEYLVDVLHQIFNHKKNWE